MEQYGLTKTDLLLAQEKINQQKDYLNKNELLTSNGQFKTLMDLSYSANHSYRYYAQLANKINTMESIALNEDLKPHFLTMTLDGFYRDLLKGDYTRFNAYSDSEQYKILKSVPDNDSLGFIRFKMINNEILTVKDLYNILNYQMRQFRNGTAFKKLYKSNKNYSYVRTVEPHKDGVPHFHMMLFIPSSFVDIFKKDFVRFFVAPRNRKKKKDLSKKEQLKYTDLKDDDMLSFQTDIKKASAYIMKYITKSFLDIKNNKELDYINAWFVKHRIIRCVTSRTVLPQWLFQKLSILEKDWYYLTDILNSPNNHSEWSKEHNCAWIYDTWSDREIAYEYGRISIYSKGKLVKRIGKVIQTQYKMVSYQNTPTTWNITPSPLNIIPIFDELNYKIGQYIQKRVKWSIPKFQLPFYCVKPLNLNKFIGYKFDYLNIYKKPHLLNDIELYDYFYSLDLDTCDLNHLGYVRNCMIQRDLLDDSLLSIDFFNTSFNDKSLIDFNVQNIFFDC